MRIGKSYSIGHIAESRFYLSIERKPVAWWRWFVSFGPTYNGTTHGVVWGTPWFAVLGHIRKVVK